MKPLFLRIGAVALSALLVTFLSGCSTNGSSTASNNAITVEEFSEAIEQPKDSSARGWSCADVYVNEDASSIQVVSLSESGSDLYYDEWTRDDSGKLQKAMIETLGDDYQFSEEYSTAFSPTMHEYARTQTGILFKAISESLYDPYSAQYESIECFYSEGDPLGHFVSRISPNAKNRLGGYTGTKTYYYDGDNVIESDNKAGGFKKEMQEYDSAASKSQATTPWAYFEFSPEDFE